MKRLAFIFLIVLFAVILSACAKTTPEQAKTTPATITPQATTTNTLSIFTEAPSPASPPRSDCPPPASAAWGGAGAGDPSYPFFGNSGYDVQHYKIDLTINLDGNQVIGEATLEATADQPLDAFNLDFLGMDISRLTVNDTEAAFCRDEAGELTVIPVKSLSRGEAFSIFVAYSGTPVFQKTGMNQFGSGWSKLGNDVFTIPDTFAFLYPSNEGFSDLASYTIRLTVPAAYQAIAIGSLDQTIPGDGVVTTIWNQNKPGIWTGLLSIASYPVTKTLVGPEGLPIRLDFPATVNETYQAEFEFVPDLLAFYSSIFGRYPYDTLGINWMRIYPYPGVAAPSRVFINTNLSDVKYFLAHELAHQWFGLGIVGARSNDMWLSEGFATYAPILWDEYQSISADESIRRIYFRLPDRTGPPANPPPEEVFAGSATIYDRPAVALHALRMRIGDDKFFSLLKTFYDRYQYKSVTTEGFISLAEEVSGQKLDDFFDAWFYQEPIPDIPQLNLTKNTKP